MDTNKVEFYQRMIDALRIIRYKQVHDISSGICHNICLILDISDSDEEDITYAALDNIFVKWPKFSGSKTYPIPGGSKLYGKEVKECTLWDNPDRWELVDFLIIHFKKELYRATYS